MLYSMYLIKKNRVWWWWWWNCREVHRLYNQQAMCKCDRMKKINCVDSFRKEDNGHVEITSNEKRVWDEEDEQMDINAKRTRTDLTTDIGSRR